MFVTWLASHLAWIGGFLLAVIFLSHIIRQRRSPSSTIAWILFIVMAPYLGVPFYLLFGGRKVTRLARSKADIRLPVATSEAVEMVAPLEHLLSGYGIPPATNGNNIKLCYTGEQSYNALVNLIEGATQTIDVCFFILHPDRVGSDIVQRLTRRAVEGVEVRLLLDGVGSLHTRAHFLKPLASAGGRFTFFNPVLHHPLRGRANLRNHRKFVIADGRTVLAGGANVACEYMGPETRPDRWRDLIFVMTGPTVVPFIQLFCADWAFATGESLETKAPALKHSNDTAGDAMLQVVPSGPDMLGDALYDALLTEIFRARRRLWLVTPYFIPDDALCRALILAVHRGVDVRLLVPQHSNHWLADIAGRSYLREIQQEGGTVLLYGCGMVHAKAVLVDDELAILGSANIDMRSLLLNYEVAVFVYSRGDIQTIEQWMAGLMTECAEGVGSVSAVGEIGEGLARLLAPQL
jgi:cardiolipin synthase